MQLALTQKTRQTRRFNKSGESEQSMFMEFFVRSESDPEVFESFFVRIDETEFEQFEVRK